MWPIDERPVPTSDVPGERAAATQPVPTKPPAFAKQGFTEDDVIDFTPEVKRLALEEVRRYRMGRCTRRRRSQGTIVMPGAIGGGGWGGGAFDPETGSAVREGDEQSGAVQAVPRGDAVRYACRRATWWSWAAR